MLNGFPTMDARLRPMFAEHHNSTLQNFAGNGLPSTIIAALIIAVLVLGLNTFQLRFDRPTGLQQLHALINRPGLFNHEICMSTSEGEYKYHC